MTHKRDVSAVSLHDAETDKNVLKACIVGCMAHS
ncbi:hypothetical protein SAMN05216236_1528 [Sedimentitalea nanhaiensis]|uniref:Uncharacterized protein n=1 Tax=Sedimentitalea nanhaiensis TaxID=999627 RepID=A0A1I7E9E1_9RHOB|nr:hypothetical protein SAMN05216236_1528 [Sedimentitalea nanhaiensis]